MGPTLQMRLAPTIAFGTWISVCVISIFAVQSQMVQPGGMDPASIDPHRSTGEISTGPYRLLMFIHPRCPCTTSSLNELHRIVLATTPRPKLEIVVVIEDASNGATDWEQLANVRKARTIPGALVRFNRRSEAQLYGARTSGHLVVSDSQGNQVYRGGVSRARGHEGTSVGSSCVISILSGQRPTDTERPVYGCSLW